MAPLMKEIGEGLLFVISLPLLAFQTFEFLHALAAFIADYHDLTPPK